MIERMFEDFTDAALIDAMGEATRDESAAIARRFSANWMRAGPGSGRSAICGAPIRVRRWPRRSRRRRTSAGAGLRARSYARVLRDELPEVAAVFATGVIDIRMVLTIIARIENVEDEVMPRLDAALARHAPMWMKLSGPKLRDRIDLWVAKFDPAGVRIPPKVNDNRYVDIGETSPTT